MKVGTGPAFNMGEVMQMPKWTERQVGEGLTWIGIIVLIIAGGAFIRQCLQTEGRYYPSTVVIALFVIGAVLFLLGVLYAAAGNNSTSSRAQGNS